MKRKQDCRRHMPFIKEGSFSRELGERRRDEIRRERAFLPQLPSTDESSMVKLSKYRRRRGSCSLVGFLFDCLTGTGILKTPTSGGSALFGRLPSPPWKLVKRSAALDGGYELLTKCRTLPGRPSEVLGTPLDGVPFLHMQVIRWSGIYFSV